MNTECCGKNVTINMGGSCGNQAQAGWELLWENPAPETAFPKQDIMLKKTAYDAYIVFFKTQTTVEPLCSSISLNKHGVHLSYAYANANGSVSVNRDIQYVSEYILKVEDANVANGTPSVIDNERLVPVSIYGLTI